MNSISAARMSILLSREATEYFHPTRGIRQGNPISPCIFILCMKFLSLMIEEEVQKKKNWKPIKIGKVGVLLTHSFFTNDSVLFGASHTLPFLPSRRFWIVFASSPDNPLTLQNSAFAPRRTSPKATISIQSTLSVNHTSSFGRYLGFPTHDGCLKTANFRFIVEKIQQKLQGWKANLLSFAGHIRPSSKQHLSP